MKAVEQHFFGNCFYWKFAYLPGECLVISHRKSKLSSFIDIVQKNRNWYISNQQMKAKLLAFHLYRERNINAKRQITNSATLLLFQTTIYWSPPMSSGLGLSFSLYHLFLRSPIIVKREIQISINSELTCKVCNLHCHTNSMVCQARSCRYHDGSDSVRLLCNAQPVAMVSKVYFTRYTAIHQKDTILLI